MTRVLLVDDDVELCDLLQKYLSLDGMDVLMAHDGQQGLQAAQSESFDLMVLDIMMPVMNGIEVLKNLRRTSDLPVIMLTAKGDEDDRIIGLEIGADDYLAKPCNPRELVARIKAIARRGRAQIQREPEIARADIQVDDIQVQPSSHKVSVDTNEVTLTVTEFNILEALLKVPGEVIEKERLAEIALGRKLTLFDRSLDMHLSNLRKKLGKNASGKTRIKTVRGVGYMYQPVAV